MGTDKLFQSRGQQDELQSKLIMIDVKVGIFSNYKVILEARASLILCM